MRLEFSNKIKAAAAMRASGACEGCGRRLLTGDFHYDHIVPDALDGKPTLDNCAVLCRSCHKLKTTVEDVPRIAKAKRNFNKARGIRKPSRFQASRNSKFKKKISGEVVLR